MRKRCCFGYIILIILFFCVPNSVSAYVTYVNHDNKIIYEEEVNNYTYFPMCSYVQTETKNKAGNQGTYQEYERINIYYLYNDQWLVAWDKATGLTTYNSVVKKSGTTDKVFNKGNNKVYISAEDLQNLKEKGTCPSDGFVDTGGGFSEVCLGNSDYCKKRNGVGTKFTASSVSSSKNYDMNDDLKTYFSNWSPQIKSCNELRSQSFNVKENLEQDFIKNFMHDKEIPGFFQNNTIYVNGMQKMTSKFTSKKEECDKEVENDNSLTEKEKEELKKQNQNGYDKLMEDIDDFKETLNSKSESGSSSNSTSNGTTNSDINYDVKDTSVSQICSMPQYRKVAKFIGTIVTFAKYVIPIIIIAFGIMDLYKAVTASKDDDIKKAAKSIAVRAAAGVFIFLLPGLVQFFFNMLNDWSNYKIDVCCCTECILNSSCDVNSCNSDSCKLEGMNN